MADRPKILCESSLQDTGAGSAAFYRVPQWSTNDTTTINDFATVTAVSAYRGDTLASVTVTILTNVITLTQAAMTNVRVYLLVVGTR